MQWFGNCQYKVHLKCASNETGWTPNNTRCFSAETKKHAFQIPVHVHLFAPCLKLLAVIQIIWVRRRINTYTNQECRVSENGPESIWVLRKLKHHAKHKQTPRGNHGNQRKQFVRIAKRVKFRVLVTNQSVSGRATCLWYSRCANARPSVGVRRAWLIGDIFQETLRAFAHLRNATSCCYAWFSHCRTLQVAGWSAQSGPPSFAAFTRCTQHCD